MGYKRYDGCFSYVLFQISWHLDLQTKIVKNKIHLLFLVILYWGLNCTYNPTTLKFEMDSST